LHLVGYTVYWNILTMHVPINVKSPNNIRVWQMGINSAFKGLNKINIHNTSCVLTCESLLLICIPPLSLCSNFLLCLKGLASFRQVYQMEIAHFRSNNQHSKKQSHNCKQSLSNFDCLYSVHFYWLKLFIHDPSKCMFDIYTFCPSHGTHYITKRDKIYKESKINYMFIYKETATT
jgi:hypothetical protein